MKKVVAAIALSLPTAAAWAQPTTPAEEQATRMACGACAGVAMAIPLIALAISIIIAIWIHRDATARGNPQATLWAVLGFLFGIVGLVVYLVVRNQAKTPPPPPPAPPATF